MEMETIYAQFSLNKESVRMGEDNKGPIDPAVLVKAAKTLVGSLTDKGYNVLVPINKYCGVPENIIVVGDKDRMMGDVVDAAAKADLTFDPRAIYVEEKSTMK